MPAKRTEPTVHCHSRPVAPLPQTGYVPAGHDASHLAKVFAAERARLAAEAKPKRGRPRKAQPTDTTEENTNQLRLVA